MTRKLSVIILLLIFGLTNGQPNPTGIQGDGNIKDTFKLVFRQAPNELFGQKSGSSDTIDSYLDGVDEFLKSYVMQLKLTNDSSYYHSMQNELKKIHATEAKRTSKELLSKKNMVLLKLCLLNPEGSRPYFAEWLTLVYPDIANQINSQQTAVLNSDMYIYFKSYL